MNIVVFVIAAIVFVVISTSNNTVTFTIIITFTITITVTITITFTVSVLQRTRLKPGYLISLMRGRLGEENEGEGGKRKRNGGQASHITGEDCDLR